MMNQKATPTSVEVVTKNTTLLDPFKNSTYFTKSSTDNLIGTSSNKALSSRQKVRIHMRRPLNKHYSMNKFEPTLEDMPFRVEAIGNRFGERRYLSPTLSSLEEDNFSYEHTLQNQFVKKFMNKEELK